MPSRSRRLLRVAEPSAAYLAPRAVMVDRNVLNDVIEADPRWADWSIGQFEVAMLDGGLVINPIIYAEIAAGFDSVESLEAAIAPFGLLREPLPWEAAFMTSQAYQRYRKRGGSKRAPMPDFYIGSHASLAGYRLLTRDARRVALPRAFFPARDHCAGLSITAESCPVRRSASLPTCAAQLSGKVSPQEAPQHFLYFFPLPQGQGSLRPILGKSRTRGSWAGSP